MYRIECFVNMDGVISVILCRRNAGQRRDNNGKHEAASFSNRLPYEGGMTYLKENQIYNLNI